MRDDLTRLLTDIRPDADFSASRDFLTDGLLDSFDLVALVSALDVRFGIAIPGVEIVPENFGSLDAIEALVRRQLARL